VRDAAIRRRRDELPGIEIRRLLLLLRQLLLVLPAFLSMMVMMILQFLATAKRRLLLSVLHQLRLGAKTLLVDASPRRLKNLSVDDHHHDARQVEGTDGREYRVSKILAENTSDIQITH